MYRKILVAVDLSGDTERVVAAAVSLAGGRSEALHLVNVVEPIAAAYSMDMYTVNIAELQQEATAVAREKLHELGATLQLAEERIHALQGTPAPEIRKLANELGVDAIVIGSHGHAGWKLLLGSTANKVLHGATCDVLTVHVGESPD